MGALLRVVSNADMMAKEKEAAVAAASNDRVISNLGSYLETCWQASVSAKQPIERRMLKSIRQREGIYEADELARIRMQGGSEIYMLLTQAKCRAAEAWIRDILLQQGDNPWGIEPTPVSELPPAANDIVRMAVAQMFALAMPGVNPSPDTYSLAYLAFEERAKRAYQQLAKKAAAGMEKKIEDQLKEGQWRGAFSAALYDFVTNLAAIIKGPVVRTRKQLKWSMHRTGQWVPIVGTNLVMEFYRVNPLDLYPSPGCRNVNDGYIIERHRMHRKNLTALLGVPGYDENIIRAVLEEHSRGGLSHWMFPDQERADLENRPHERLDPHGNIDAQEFTGSVQGRWLIEWGAKGNIDPDLEYDANVWKIGRHVIRAMLNPHPLNKRLYHKACWEEMPDSFWGKTLPEHLSDTQDMCNATGRSLSNNLSLSSGPQVEVSVDRVPAGQDVNAIYPWKVWQTNVHKAGVAEPAVRFHDVPSNAQELIAVYDRFERIADNVSGVPSYSYGDTNQGGAGKTASGLSMLMGNAARGIKKAIAHLDEGIVEPAVTELYNHNMLHSPDQSIKGDLKVVARGATAMIVKEQQQIRRTEFLQTTANPIDAQIMGPGGRAELIKENAKALDLDPEKVVPGAENMEIMQAGAVPPSASAAPQPGAPRELDAAGNPAGGQDAALFNQ